MDEYISKHEPIEEIKRIYCTSCNSYNGAMCRACEHQDDIDIIEDTKAADVQPVNQWISVKDRLPEVNTMVIVACYGSGIVIPKDKETVEECCKRFQRECVRVTLGFIGSDGWYDSDCSAMIISPLYWQPLPEPPKDGDTE